jgi:hypothetical protein
MSMVKSLTGPQRDFLISYFKAIFHDDAEFAEADEAKYLAELGQTDFSHGDIVHGRVVMIARALEKKGILAEVDSEALDGGHTLYIAFNENTARVVYDLVQETKAEGTFYELAGLPAPSLCP